MTIMNAKLRAATLATLPALLLLTGCADSGGTPQAAPGSPSSSSPGPSTSVKPAAPGPTYPDVTKGDSSTAAWLTNFDATAHSAVIDPVIFMEGPTYCKKYRIRASDARCNEDYVIVDSHQKAAIPVSPAVKLYTAFSDTEDCAGLIETGGRCPITEAKFATLAKTNKNDFLVHVTIVDGTATRLAEEYRP
jgi:hypothetical protein